MFVPGGQIPSIFVGVGFAAVGCVAMSDISTAVTGVTEVLGRGEVAYDVIHDAAIAYLTFAI